MDILTAMKKCERWGHVARRAYPNRRYVKDAAGIFRDAPLVDYIDFIADDWESHAPAAGCSPEWEGSKAINS